MCFFSVLCLLCLCACLPHRWGRETWWWNKEVDDAIKAKRQAFKAWKAGKCTRASYNTAKCISRCVVHHARQEADKVVYEGIDHKSSDIFRLANQMRKENVDVVGDKPVKNDTGEMSMSEEAKQNAWAEHYERLLNVDRGVEIPKFSTCPRASKLQKSTCPSPNLTCLSFTTNHLLIVCLVNN